MARRRSSFFIRPARKPARKRNEFILLSDTLGLSTVVDMISSRGEDEATAVSVLGPFYIEGAPMIKNGGDLIGDNAGQGKRWCEGSRIRRQRWRPRLGAHLLDVWQNAGRTGTTRTRTRNRTTMNLTGPPARRRRREHTPSPRSDRHPIRCRRTAPQAVRCWRPWGATRGDRPISTSRVHGRGVSGPDLITEIYPDDDAYIDADAVFGVRESLAVAFKPDGNAQKRKPDNMG